MRQEYPPEKDTKHSAPAPLRRRLHEFYCGRSRFVVLRAAKRTTPTVSFRTPPRGATARRKSCPSSWRTIFHRGPNFGEHKSSKTPHSPLKNSCSHATGTKKDGCGATRGGEPGMPPSRIVEIGLELIIVSGEWSVRWFPPAWKVRNSQQWWPQSLRRCPHPESVLLPS